MYEYFVSIQNGDEMYQNSSVLQICDITKLLQYFDYCSY